MNDCINIKDKKVLSFIEDNKDLLNSDLVKLTHKAFNDLYERNYEIQTFVYILLKSGLMPTTNYDEMNVENNTKAIYELPFDTLYSINVRTNASASSNKIDWETCLNLIGDAFDVFTGYDYSPSYYRDVIKDVKNDKIKIDADNKRLIDELYNKGYSDEDIDECMPKAAASAARLAASDDAHIKAEQAVIDCFDKKLFNAHFNYDNDPNHPTFIVEFEVSNELAEFYKEAANENEAVDFYSLICYIIINNYSFIEPYAGFNDNFDDIVFNDELYNILLDLK